MKLIITDPVSVTAPKNIFKLTVEFMVGDADGKQFSDIKIDSELYNTDETYRDEVHRLIKALDEVIALDRKGRGGYDDLHEMLDDHYKGMEILDFLAYHGWDDETGDDIEHPTPTEFTSLMFEFPSQDDWYTSFRGYKITYFNPIGIEFQVNIDK